MLDFRVDAEKCIGCGECVKDCMPGVLEMHEDRPQVVEGREEYCIRCQHCFTICMPGAIRIFGLDPEKSLPVEDRFPDPDRMETLIKGRRSFRRYKKTPVEPELIHSILDTVRHAPTGVNNASTLLTVVDDPAVMDVIREKTVKAGAAILSDNALPEGFERMKGYLKPCLEGVDVVFRGAPHLLVASSPAAGPSPEADCFIALSYFELLAQSCGLGTVWDGLAEIMLTMLAPDIGALLNIPEDHATVYMMAFGRPAVKYHRTVQRPGGEVRRVTLN